MEMEIKSRNEIDPKYTWDLTRVYKDDAAWEKEFAAVAGEAAEYGKLAGTLCNGREAVLSNLNTYFDLNRRLSSLYSYAMMKQNEDTGNETYQAMNDRASTLLGTVMAESAYLSPELLSLPEDVLEAYAVDPDFENYSVFLHETIRQKPHVLTQEGEQILAMSMDTLTTMDAASEMIRSLDLKLGKTRGDDGKLAPLTDASFILFLESTDRNVRRLAFTKMMQGYGSMGNTFAALYAGQIKADIFTSRVRKFGSSREASLFEDEISESVYDSLIEAVHGGIGTLDQYLNVRREKMGLSHLHMYDLYCLGEGSFEIQPDIEEAFDIFLKAVAPLGKDYVKDASRALKDRWIDVYENKGKRSGAYSTVGAYGVSPYVLLNHKKNYDGLSTLAHEMGHAMHSFYSNKTQPYAKADYAIFVAEVASTTNEILLNEYLRKVYKDDKDAQIMLIGTLLEHFRTTVFRQTLFAEFEHEAHRLAENGESLTQARLNALYLEIVKTYYRHSCTVDACVQTEWMRIPHFYSPFYVYKYATGFCAAAALAQNILSGDPEKVASYRRFLTLGGSMAPIEELKIAGVDMSTPEPVCRALDYFAELVLQYQELLG